MLILMAQQQPRFIFRYRTLGICRCRCSIAGAPFRKLRGPPRPDCSRSVDAGFRSSRTDHKPRPYILYHAECDVLRHMTSCWPPRRPAPPATIPRRLQPRQRGRRGRRGDAPLLQRLRHRARALPRVAVPPLHRPRQAVAPVHAVRLPWRPRGHPAVPAYTLHAS
jgi:hypothetical protein